MPQAPVRIFLSYTRADQTHVERLYQQLRQAGFTPWMDTKDLLPGQKFEYYIKQAIRQSDFFLACLSKKSVNRRGVLQREIKEALDVLQERLESDIFLIPVRLEDCDVPESLREFHWANVYEDDGLQKLLQAIQVGIENQRATGQTDETGQVKSLAEEPDAKEWTEPTTGMEFVRIPPGRFWMGATDADKKYLIQERVTEWYKEESPRHEVTIKEGFWMGKYPVTQEQWLKVMGKNPSYFNEGQVGQEWRKHPVENVSWDDAQEFMRKLNILVETGRRSVSTGVFRLPSEAEWEYTCRAGTETIFYFGDDVERLSDYAWYSENSRHKTHPVGQLQPNAYGLYDMLGNVWEWCADLWHDSYQGASADGSVWAESGGSVRVLRGGSWDNEPRGVRSANRLDRALAGRRGDIGFRLVRTI
jgi:formylglycine-generating enzyme required for sulfatase activity